MDVEMGGLFVWDSKQLMTVEIAASSVWLPLALAALVQASPNRLK